MPELIHSSVNPLKDAIAKVTCNGRDYWTMTGWTNPGTADIPTMFMDSIALRNQVNATSGLRGTVTHPNGQTRSFTIRHDYDFVHGMPPAGKGYHVNVELPHEKHAYITNYGQQYFEDCVQMLSQRRYHDGDVMSSQWFMNACMPTETPNWLAN